MHLFHAVKIDFLVRKGNESLLKNNPHINEVLIWDKKNNKTKNLFRAHQPDQKESVR
ncbi:MAG: hypothetical protein V9E88_12920 [Ferruginibacter sp.]